MNISLNKGGDPVPARYLEARNERSNALADRIRARMERGPDAPVDLDELRQDIGEHGFQGINPFIVLKMADELEQLRRDAELRFVGADVLEAVERLASLLRDRPG